MSDQINNYTDSSFNLYQAYGYTLLIQVEASSFNYAVVYQNRLLESAQNCDLDELAHPKLLSDVLTATYKKVIIGLPAIGLTLVPQSLFSEAHVADFARFLDVKETEKVFVQKLNSQNVIIYKTRGDIAAAVERYDLQNTVYSADGWINAVEKSNPQDNSLYLEIGKDIVHFLHFSSGTLRFYNTFEFKNPDELIYFTAFVSEELQLKPQSTTLILSGDISFGDKNMSRLTDFYPKIEINALKILELPEQIPSYKFLALAALSLCELSEAL